MSRRSYIGKYVERDQRDKNDTPAILMRRTNAGYRLCVRRYREKVGELTRLYAQIKNARMSLRSAAREISFQTDGTAEARQSGSERSRSARTDECNYARCKVEGEARARSCL